MLYLKLRQYLLTERAAIAAMQTFAGFNGVISPRRARRPDGTAAEQYAVLVPGGRRPSSVEEQLRTVAPHTDWTLVDVDAEGFETVVMPEAKKENAP
jgi:hypothetical protein